MFKSITQNSYIKYSLLLFLYVYANQAFSQSISRQLWGLSVGDSYYFKPREEPGDFNIGAHYINQLSHNYEFETTFSYAIEGLNEVWLQPKFNIIASQYDIKPYFSIGSVIQFEPELNIGTNTGMGFIAPIERISPFLFLRLSTQFNFMLNQPRDIVWEFFQLSLLIEF